MIAQCSTLSSAILPFKPRIVSCSERRDASPTPSPSSPESAEGSRRASINGGLCCCCGRRNFLESVAAASAAALFPPCSSNAGSDFSSDYKVPIYRSFLKLRLGLGLIPNKSSLVSTIKLLAFILFQCCHTAHQINRNFARRSNFIIVLPEWLLFPFLWTESFGSTYACLGKWVHICGLNASLLPTNREVATFLVRGMEKERNGIIIQKMHSCSITFPFSQT